MREPDLNGLPRGRTDGGALEQELQGELEGPGTALRDDRVEGRNVGRIADGPETAASDVVLEGAEVRPVQDVETLDPNLELRVPSELRGLDQREVPLRETRSTDRVAAAGADRAVRGHGEDARVRDVVVGVLDVVLDRAIAIRPHTVEVLPGAVTVRGGGVGPARQRRIDRGELPTPADLPHSEVG